jgi:hypothetical protein
LDPEADELQIEDFEIMPSLGVSFEIVTGFPFIHTIGCLGKSKPMKIDPLR